MDTRNKILTLDGAAALRGEILLVTGTFDVLRVEHVREMETVRRRTPAAILLAVVLPSPGAPLGDGARADMAAALRVIDYVVAANPGEVELLIGSLKPIEVVRLEAAHARIYAHLIDHVRRRQDS